MLLSFLTFEGRGLIMSSQHNNSITRYFPTVSEMEFYGSLYKNKTTRTFEHR